MLAGGNGYKGQNELVLHVGLDQATSADEVVAFWPGGGTDPHPDRPAGRAHLDALSRPSGSATRMATPWSISTDFVVLAACFEVPLEPGCEVMDFDGDSAVDMADFDAFLEIFDGDPADCNGNGIPDMREILLGQAERREQRRRARRLRHLRRRLRVGRHRRLVEHHGG